MFFIVPTLLKVLIFLLGILCLYIGLFVYESKHKTIQNKLVDLWVSVSSVQEENHASLLASKTYHYCYNKIIKCWGNRVITIHSILFSLLMFLSFYLIAKGIFFDGVIPKINAVIFFVIGLLLLLSSIYVSLSFRKWFTIFSFTTISGFLAYIYFTCNEQCSPLAIYLCIVVTITVLSILGSISSMKFINSSPKIHTKWFWLLLLHSLIAFVITLFLITAFVAAVLIGTNIDTSIEGSGFKLCFEFNNMFEYPASFGALICLVLFNLVLGLLVVFVAANKVTWLFLKLPIEFLYEHKLIKSGKIMVGLGLLCMVVVLPNAFKADIFVKLFKLLGISLS